MGIRNKKRIPYDLRQVPISCAKSYPCEKCKTWLYPIDFKKGDEFADYECSACGLTVSKCVSESDRHDGISIV